MRMIDSDAHVIETQRTRQFMEGEDARFRPILASSPGQTEMSFWIMDGEYWGIARLGGRDYKELTRLYRKITDANAAAFYGL